MMVFLWRSLLIISFGLIGMYIGFWAGATHFVPKNAGLAGGAMVLGYGVLGAAIFAIVGAIVAFWLQAEALRNTAVIVAIPVVLFYLGLAVVALLKAVAEREPDAAFDPAGIFTVSMERVDSSDPYLFTNMHVDSRTRKWAQTGPAPEHKVCSATTKAKNLIEIRIALNALLELDAGTLSDCASKGQPVIKRLYWDLMDGQVLPGNLVLPKKGTLEVTSSCLRQHAEVARIFSLVEKISLQSGGKIRCD